MAFEVHREPLYRRYYASAASGACCYAFIFGFVLIFLPLIIAYNSSTFWIKENISYEQPGIAYKHIAIFQLSGRSIDTGDQLNLFYSTSSTINQLYESKLRIALVKSAEFDDNRDGLTDRLELSLQMPLSENEEITSINALFFYEVKVSQKAKVMFDAVSYLNYESATSLGKLSMDGNLLLQQTWALSSKGGYDVLYTGNDQLLQLSDKLTKSETSISYIMAKASSRNLTLTYQPNYNYADRASYITTDKSLRYFNASFIQRIPEQGIRYTPPVSEVLKYAWIQYISFFAVISFLLFRLNSFVYRHQLLYTHTVADIMVEKLD